jgi:choline dehydrogenase-like flavoprotein
MTKQTFDVTIVGGGSAGAVLAARLSADTQRRVLLLEAGPNFPPDHYPPILTDANVVAGSPTFDWHYHTEDAARLGHDIPVPRGRVIGGSSAVNAAVAMRARPADFARWAQRGIKGWPWEEAFAAYKALENTPTGDDAWHGRSGPFPIRQRTAEENTPSMRAFVEASEAVGWRTFRISTARLRMASAPTRSTSSTGCASIRGSLISPPRSALVPIFRFVGTPKWTASLSRASAPSA